jgi:hypothetical protein
MADDYDEFLAYVTQLRTEHKRLGESIHGIEQQWRLQHSGSDQADVLAQMLESLQSMRAELAHHFEEEESGGCLEEAVSHEPHLGPEATRLVREHPELLAQMDRLIEGLRALARLTASADEVEQDFRNFTEKLLAHEAAENRVLKEGFGIDVE